MSYKPYSTHIGQWDTVSLLKCNEIAKLKASVIQTLKDNLLLVIK